MAEGDDQERTQEPTDKKLEDARKRGDVPISSEMRHAVMFGAMLLVLGTAGEIAFRGFAELFAKLWGRADQMRFEAASAHAFSSWLLGSVAWILLPILGILFGAAVLIPFLQGRPTLSLSRLEPKLSKISPISGFGRLFSVRALVEFAKTLGKFAAVAVLAWLTLEPRVSGINQLVEADPLTMLHVTGTLARDIVLSVALLAAAFALFDLVYQRHSFMKRMRMSLQEIRDEIKQSEGDPKVKAQIRAIRLSRARKRMMASVPNATVVITNPTHYSVALQYDHATMAAPVVVAKGVDELAFKIREVAREAGVPVLESPPLARALYATVDIDRPIPTEHYAAVAEIISFVIAAARKKG